MPDEARSRRVIVMGAGGRDFHDFNVVLRDDPTVEVVAFTATQIPGIEGRTYPPDLAGPRYPDGIPIESEERLTELIRDESVDEVVFAYSDVSYDYVMHRAAMALAAGAGFRLIGPGQTMLESSRPVVAVCAIRTGSGKSPLSRAVGRVLLDAGLRVALVRHPMPYHDLDQIRAQRFETLEDIDASNPTIEEREEYERPVELGLLTFAGVDYAEILGMAEAEADVLIWDGGNNDLPFFRPDVHLVVMDPLRADDAAHYHPGEANLRMADVVVVNKVDTASEAEMEAALAQVEAANPGAAVIQTACPVTLEDGDSLSGKDALVIDDGPTITHGGMPFGAGMIAARAAGAKALDPRPYAAGSLGETFRSYPHIGDVLPAMGYSDEQLRELEQTIAATPCAAVIAGTPIDLDRIVESPHPIRQARYEIEHVAGPTLEQALAPAIESARR